MPIALAPDAALCSRGQNEALWFADVSSSRQRVRVALLLSGMRGWTDRTNARLEKQQIALTTRYRSRLTRLPAAGCDKDHMDGLNGTLGGTAALEAFGKY